MYKTSGTIGNRIRRIYMEGHKEKVIGSAELQNIMPHRYPMLLLDRLILVPDSERHTQIEPGMKVAGIKNVTANEPFFKGHFPRNPIMPGVLIVEALAQCACAGGLILEDNKGKLGLFTGIDNMKFRHQVVPGDRLLLEVEFLSFRRDMGKAKAKATVDGVVVAEGILKFAMVENK
jgi:3-hydroxyacyl-[acyl-carrier-protein] dehydratase